MITKPSQIWIPHEIFKFDKSLDVIDPSKIKDFYQCQRYFFFKHVLGWRSELKSNDLIFGSAWHKAKEFLFKNGLQTAWNYEVAFQHFNDYYLQHIDWDPELYYPKSPKGARIGLLSYMDKFAFSTDWETLATEVWGDLDLSEGKSIRFRMDLVILDKTLNAIMVVDHKTSRTSREMYRKLFLNSFQMMCYIYACKVYYKSRNVKGAWIDRAEFFKTKVDHLRIPIIPSDEMLQAWMIHALDSYDEILRQTQRLALEDHPKNLCMRSFPMRESGCSAYGKLCEFFNICTSYANPLKIKEIPSGFVREFWDPSEAD